jgi:hypothetical protein
MTESRAVTDEPLFPEYPPEPSRMRLFLEEEKQSFGDFAETAARVACVALAAFFCASVCAGAWALVWFALDALQMGACR